MGRDLLLKNVLLIHRGFFIRIYYRYVCLVPKRN